MIKKSMMKRSVASILIAAMLATVWPLSTPTVTAATAQSTRNEVVTLLNIVSKNQNGNLGVKKEVTRGEFAKMLSMAAGYHGKVSKSKTSLYSDVKAKSAYSGYIKLAVENEWMTGYLDGSFRPKQVVKLSEAVNATLRLLGYTSEDFVGNRVNAQMALYKKKKLNKNITKTASQNLTKKDCINLFYNLLSATTKEGKQYGVVLDCPFDSEGAVDDMTLVTQKIKGPVIATASWTDNDKFSFMNSQTKYYRNNKVSKRAAIKTNDVLYYSKILNKIWAYNQRATGVLEAASPSRISPTSITLSGTTYELGTKKMRKAFSTSYGDYDIGDTVTIMLGKDGTIVNVLNEALENMVVNGIVLSKSTGTSVALDTADLVDFIRIVDVYGVEHEYEVASNANLNLGDAVQVSFLDGDAVATELVLDNVNGTFYYEKKRFGTYRIADDINLLDLYGDVYKVVQPERLEGVLLNDANILYYEVNTSNEITDMILSNATGDLYTYGIMTSSTENVNVNLGAFSGTYHMIINGAEKSFSTNGTTFGISNTVATPAGILLDSKNTVKAVQLLTYTSVTGVSNSQIRSGSTYRTLADDVQVYIKNQSNGVNYYKTTLSKVSDLTTYYLQAYYDKGEGAGGRIRVMIAEKR
ncbi:MAG: S-layer homology domain-containing protein [Lachnospiraceae bacterium]